MSALKGKMEMEEAVNQILKNLPTLKSGSRLVVGVDGMSRSGKTTLSATLMQHFEQNGISAISFHLDDFIVEKNRRYGTGEAEWIEYYQLQWEADWLRANFFGQLNHATELELPFYDGQNDERRTKKVMIPSSCVIVVEGVFLQRTE